MGKTDVSDEHMFLTKTGLKLSRAAPRKPERERWSLDAIEEVRGAPSNPYGLAAPAGSSKLAGCSSNSSCGRCT